MMVVRIIGGLAWLLLGVFVLTTGKSLDLWIQIMACIFIGIDLLLDIVLNQS